MTLRDLPRATNTGRGVDDIRGRKMPKTEISGGSSVQLVFVSRLSDKQETFVSKYLGGKYFNKAARKRLKIAHAGVTSNLERLDAITTQIGAVVSTKEEYDFLWKVKSESTRIVSKIADKGNSTIKAAEAMETADRELAKLTTDAERFINELTMVEGRDLDLEIAVQKLQTRAHNSRLQHLSDFDKQVSSIREDIADRAPRAVFSPPAKAEFDKAFNEFNVKIITLDLGGKEVTVENVTNYLDTVKTDMKSTYDDCIDKLESYQQSDIFQTHLLDAETYDSILSALEDLKPLQEAMYRWEAEGFKEIASKATAIETQAEKIFENRGEQVSEAELKKAVEVGQKLEAATRELIRRANTEIGKSLQAFGEEQKLLLNTWNALKGRMDTLGKGAMPKEQRGPIDEFLAATLDSIQKLNGANKDALQTARLMLAEADTLVRQAEGIGPINAAIEEAIGNAKNALKPLVKDKMPLQEEATELDKELTAFEGKWKSQTPNDAKSDAEDLLRRAQDVRHRTNTLVYLRKSIEKTIQQEEKHIEQFNALFKEMLANMGKKPRDYRGAFKSELEGIRTWNATKQDIAFYPTIDRRLDTLKADIDKEIAHVRFAKDKTSEQLVQYGKDATKVFRETVQKLQEEAGEDGEMDKEAYAEAQRLYDEQMSIATTQLNLEMELRDAERQDEKYKADREQFLRDVETWLTETRNELKNAKTGDPFDTYKDEVERQRERIKSTRDIAKKEKVGPSGSRGLAELKEVRKAVDRIRARGETTSKENLGAIAGQWRQSVGIFKGKVGELVGAVKEFESTTDVAKDAHAELDRITKVVISRMEANQIGPASFVLGSGDATPAERKKARETALSEVRRIKKLVLDDPVIQSCVGNPFGVTAVASQTINRLEEIELNVLRGV